MTALSITTIKINFFLGIKDREIKGQRRCMSIKDKTEEGACQNF